jgi:hypothetical protein
VLAFGNEVRRRRCCALACFPALPDERTACDGTIGDAGWAMQSGVAWQVKGISAALRRAAHVRVSLPMRGMAQSYATQPRARNRQLAT